jgi:hypothetical protein
MQAARTRRDLVAAHARLAGWLVAAALAGACGASAASDHRPLAAEDHSYRVPADLGSLVVDDAAFAAFARELRSDLEAAVRGSAQRGEPWKDRVFVLAMLDALDDHWPQAVARLDLIAANDDQPAAKVMRGLTIRIWADARASGGDTSEAFRAALERALATLPVDLVRDQLAVLRTMAQILSPASCRQLVDEEIGPEVKHGAVSFESAHAIVFQHYAAKRLTPVGPVIDAVLAAHGIEAAR